MTVNKQKDTSDFKNPFPGLRPFKVEESHLFFGREGQSEEILNKLSNENFVAVIGASGSGKSSLIYCGLVPILFGGFVGDSNSEWKIIATRPGNSPIDNLASVINNSEDNEVSDDDLLIKQKLNSSILRSSSNGLIEAVDQNYDLGKQNILVIIDQFEELFRYKTSKSDESTYNESEAFVKLLVETNRNKEVPIYIVLTMRSDFIGECSQFHELTELINDSNYLVPQMTRDDFKRAIEGPIAVGGAEIEPQLVQQLLNEVGDNPDQLPILQHALMRTWNYWTEHSDINQAISLSDYEAIGKMEKALSEHANEAFDELSDDEKWICESMFKTITEKGNDNRGIRHPTSITDIALIAKASTSEVKKIIEPFRAAGRSFITPSYEKELEDDSIIDLSHESLMRIWNKLRIWVEEEWNAVQMYMRLSEAAEMYQLGKTGLWRPPDLQLALNWRDKQKPTLAWAKRYNPAFERAMVYLQTSDKEFKAEEENKVKLQKRQLRRSKIFAIVLGTAAIIGVGLTIYSQTMKTKAQEQERIAKEEKQKADRQTEIAEEQRLKAQEEEEKALKEKEEADKARELAQEQEKIAKENADIAERQKQLALRRQQEANSERKRAEANAEEALKQQKEAESARELALRRRMLSIAQSMAVKSQQISDNTQLKALIAYQAYIFNQTYEGPKHNPDIYLGLYYALKGLKGQSYNALNGHEGSVMAIGFDPNSKAMYTTGGDGKIIKWDMSSEEMIYNTIVEHPYMHRALEITYDGKWLVYGTDQSEIQIINLENSVEQDKILTGHTSFVTGIVVDSENKFFLSMSNDKTIRKWNFENTDSEILIQSSSRINTMDIFNKTLVVGTQDGRITVYNLDNIEDSKVIYEDRNAITTLAFNNKGSWMVSGDSKGKVRVFDTRNYQEIKVLEGHKARIYDIDFNPNDDLFATSSLDGTVRVWDSTDLNNQPIELKDHESWVLSIKFTPDGNKLITSSNKKDRILIWDTKTENIANQVVSRLERNMTNEEWNTYVADDIPYEETKSE